MINSDIAENNHTAKAPESNVLDSLKRALNYDRTSKVAQFFVVLNFIFLFIKPQLIISPLGSIKVAIGIFLIAFAFWLQRTGSSWTFPVKIMSFFLVIHAIFIIWGRFIDDSFIVNDGKAFDTWKTLLQVFLCFLFPIMAYCQGPIGLKKLISAIIFCGWVLASYAITHHGFGPGDFVGDENDVCAVIVTFLPFPFLLLTSSKGLFRKLIILAVIITMIAGIVITASRGGFVGLVAGLIYMWWISPRKIVIAALLTTIFLVSLPFVPNDYIKEVKSISETDSGTALKRRDLWRAAFASWLDPHNFLTGVGLNNISWRINEYEGIEFRTIKASQAGRAVHSMLFQMIADLGLLGIVMLVSLIYVSMRRNQKWEKRIKRRLNIIRKLNSSTIELEQLNTASFNVNSTEEIEVRYFLASRIKLKLKYMQACLLATNAAWIGHCVSGLFVSILYYPTFWFLAILSACLQSYSRVLLSATDEAIVWLEPVENSEEAREYY
jgi:hypothetical protein